ncbi:acetyl esterase [Sphingomonas laterariae]|uniref:Acetyl esterase n=1 Tax=Edaphosphingomonas laterariae TaxID=861865 RepID=A0A239BNC9_9SPHN|nr:alpha/beta hydrolase [Sphingomonas laterariae]SNS08878.1 acetyl esterase [Sphingomonas laterariae]
MPLNATSSAILAHINASAPDMKAISPIEFRAYSAQMVQPADPADRIVTTDADADGVPVRIYRREEAGDAEPVLVFYHGGGYIACGIESHDRLCHRLARLAECAIVSVDYRLAPEHAFPAAVDDALAALRWVQANGTRYGLDTSRIAVGGDSAGGTLATVTAARARDEGGPAIVHQLMFYPGADMVEDTPSRREFAKGYFLDDDFSELCISAYVTNPADRAHPWASPIRAKDLTRLPPATIITAECDPLRDEGRNYAETLRAAGVATDYTDYAGVFHGFVSMFGLVTEADQAVAQAAAALKKAFGTT